MCQRKAHTLCDQGATDILERPQSILILHRKYSCETSEHKELKSKPPGERWREREELIGDGLTAGVLLKDKDDTAHTFRNKFMCSLASLHRFVFCKQVKCLYLWQTDPGFKEYFTA